MHSQRGFSLSGDVKSGGVEGVKEPEVGGMMVAVVRCQHLHGSSLRINFSATISLSPVKTPLYLNDPRLRVGAASLWV